MEFEMIIGTIKTPNKWALTAQTTNMPFEYTNCLPGWSGYGDSWGNSIIIDPWVETYKIISQDGFRICEYWCIRINNGELSNVFIPVGMKRYGYSNSQAKCFAFQTYIGDVLMMQNRRKPNFNPSMVYSSSVAELIVDAITNGSQWEGWADVWHKLNMNGATTLRFPSGGTSSIDFMVRRCCIVDMYGRNVFNRLNEATDLHDIGVTTERDLLNLMYDFLPMNVSQTLMEVDWIGECIMAQYLRGIEIEAVKSQTISTPNAQNLISMLTNASRTEELVNVENIQPMPLVVKGGDFHDRLMVPSRIGDKFESADIVLECMEDIITDFMADEATTYAIHFDYNSGKTQIIDRVYGYGLASKEQDRCGGKFAPPESVIDFSVRNLCECLCARAVRFIKTFNEELFVTVWYDDGRVESYYYNLIIHMCVTGSLFSG